MVLATQPKAEIKGAGRNHDQARRARSKRRAARQQRKARRSQSPGQPTGRPLPGHFPAALAIPLPSPRPPQNVGGRAGRIRKSKLGRRRKTQSGRLGHRHFVQPVHPPAAPRPRPTAHRPAVRPRSRLGGGEPGQPRWV